ncbi:MAG: hypothetical protein ABIR28_03055 [Vicinamibacteria bacterium]
MKQTTLLLMLTTLLAGVATAQTAPPCKPGDSVLSLGKAAFFRSIERAASAIGERTLEDLTDSRGDSTQPAGTKRSRPGHSSVARAAAFSPGADSALADPLRAYVDSPSSDAADAAFNNFLANATKVLFETIPERSGVTGSVGLGLESGKLYNRGAELLVSEMVDERRRQKLEGSLFGDGPDLNLGAVDKKFASSPFFKAPVIVDARDVDRNNIGLKVVKESELRDLWFKDYRSHLTTANSAVDPAVINTALNAGWPTLQKFWAFKRTEIFISRGQMAFGLEMREIQSRFNDQSLPLLGCEVKFKPAPPLS